MHLWLSFLCLLPLMYSFKHTVLPSLTKKAATILKYGNRGHDMSSIKWSDTEQMYLKKLQQYDVKAAKLSMAEHVRTLIEQSNHFGVLSTNSVEFPGFPTGSVVGFAVDDANRPFFSFSNISKHTKDVIQDGKVSLTVMAKDFQGADNGRATIIGNLSRVPESERPQLREKYLQTHKGAYWIDFGDFTMYQMDTVVGVRYVGGFATAASVTVKDYQAAKPDPTATYAAQVMEHMNKDHTEALVRMVQHFVEVPCTEATMTAVDRLGMTLKIRLSSESPTDVKVRLPFIREITDRNDMRLVMMEMAATAKSGGAQSIHPLNPALISH